MPSRLALVFAAPFMVSASLPPTFVNVPQIAQVVCAKGYGTAFRTGPSAYTSAAHVLSMSDCKINGEPVVYTFLDRELDFAVARVASVGDWLKVDCEGFKDGHIYLGAGYAMARPMQRAIVAVASDEWRKIVPWGTVTVLVGNERYIPGMSGGPVFNERGEVTGIIKGYHSGGPISYSRQLKDTALCQSSPSSPSPN